MSHQYMLDTNIVSELVHHPRGKIYQKILQVGPAQVCTSIIVTCEMQYGTVKRQSPRLSQQVDSVLSTLAILPLEAPTDEYYAIARTQLEQQGLPIGGNDLLIAAHALTLGLTLVTANVREFQRVNGLQVENWL